MTEQFKPGEVVRVISGGPKMTVTQVGKRAVTGEEAVWCTWFAGTKKQEDTL